ncbi:MAG: head GIN domain-containing protein [Bacteroidales bacterium]|nr:head GIN domain-containing protein [Bacteroidales bacterium]
MKKTLLSLVFIMAIAAGYTTASAQQVKEQRSVNPFTQIMISGSVDISFTQGDETTVTVVADKKDISDIITRVKGNTLVVSRKGNSNFSLFGNSSNEANVLVTAPELIMVEIGGSGDFEGENTITGPNFSLKINGSGDFESDMDVENMKVNIAGSGDSEFSGVTKTLDVAINGSGDVECEALRLGYLNIEIYGSGDISAKGYAETCPPSNKMVPAIITGAM